MKLHCQHCNAVVPADNINMEKTLAVCPECDAIFRFGDSFAPEKPKRRKLKTPDRFSIEAHPDLLRIVYRWFQPTVAVSVTIFVILWDGFLIFWYASAIGKGSWLMALFGSLHALVGIGFTYYVVALYRNRTEITVAGGRVSVRHLPLPWVGNTTLDAHNIEQLYVKQNLRRSRRSASYSYEVRAVTHSGPEETLVRGLDEPRHAFYIEQQIENYLGIENRPVYGEFQG